MLDPTSRMVMIAVEGTSAADTQSGGGEEVIDIAEYYGTKNLATAEQVIYRQFKHSTVNDHSQWTASWMKKTLVGFAKKYAAIRDEHPSRIGRTTYILTTNRPAKPEIHRALAALREGSGGPNRKASRDISYISRLVAPIVGDDRVADFLEKFLLEDAERGLIDQRGQLERQVSGYLPGAPTDGYVLLKEMIAVRATSEYSARNFATRHDVLAALKVTEDQILPAPNLFSSPEDLLETDQFHAFAATVTESNDSSAVIGHATGGVGKSVLAHAFGAFMPTGSTTVVYDCFGNGTYRRPSSPRHEARHALVQICNELAAKGLSDLVLPSPTASDNDYFRIFRQRIEQACNLLAKREPRSLVTIAVDAADNAALVARDTGTRSFVSGLLRESMPANCRLVLFCRTERLDLLNPPPSAVTRELKGFSLQETARFLRTRFLSVPGGDIAEFHRITRGHPRAQAAALASKASVQQALSDLGGLDQTPETIIYKSIRDAIENARDAHSNAPHEVDRLCEALAALRPMIPTQVLAAVAGVPEPLVESFVSDLGRPLLIDSGAVQFRDEPTETWFHENCRPTGTRLNEFLDRVMQLADDDPYLATSLPDLLLEAGRIDALIDLALNLAHRAEGQQLSYNQSDLERYEIAQHTVQVALKGALRGGNELAAARLALNAGKLAAGHGRRLKLIRDNPDLASEFLDPSLQEHLIATRALAGDWPGANVVSESAMLATARGQRDLARHHLRGAVEWTTAWVRRPSTEDHTPSVEIRDIADLAWGALNTDGPAACAAFLERWKPLTIAFEAGLIVARRLGDVGRIDDLLELVRGKGRPKHLKLAVAQTLWEYDIDAPEDVVRTLLSTLRRHRKPMELVARRKYDYSDELPGLDGIVWIVALAFRFGTVSREEGVQILDLYLPDNPGSAVASWYRPKAATLMRGFAVRSHLNGSQLDPDSIADPRLEKDKERGVRGSRTLHEHNTTVVPLCRWMNLWVSSVVGSEHEIACHYDQLRGEHMRKYSDYDPPRFLINALPRVAVRILSRIEAPEMCDKLAVWCEQNAQFMSWPTLTEVVRVASGSVQLRDIVPVAAQLVRDSVATARDESAAACDALVALGRASYRLDPNEGREHFHEALKISEHAGDDLYERWRTFTLLAKHFGRRSSPDDERAQRLLRIAECVMPYMGDGIWAADPLMIAGTLSPIEAIAGASRWRDRCVADIDAISVAFASRDSDAELEPTIALAFAALSERVPRVHWLTAAFRSAPERGALIAKAFGDFERSTPRSDEDYAEIDAAAAQAAVDLGGTKYDPIYRAVRKPVRLDGFTSRDWFSTGASGSSPYLNVAESHEELDFRSAEVWNSALRSARGNVSRGSSDDVIDAALSGPTVDLAEVLAAFRGSDEFNLFDCNRVLGRLKSINYLPLALRGEARALCEVVLERFPRQLTCARYEPLDLDVLARLTGWDADQFIGDALERLGKLPDRLSSDECYSLATRLSDRLDDNGVAEVFDECASLFGDVVSECSTDDRGEAAALQPKTVTEAVAAFLWAALGDPRAEVRWRAAHAVDLLLQFGELPMAIALFAAATDSRWLSGFVDPRLVFYRKHALQWLLFAMAHASQARAELVTVAIFEPLLRTLLLDQPPHVVMQHSARHCVRSLHSAGLIRWSQKEMDYIATIGTPVAEVNEDLDFKYRRVLTLSDLLTVEASDGDLSACIAEFDDDESMQEYPGDNEFRYFIDFRDDWCAPLGDAFGLHRDAVERLVGDLAGAEAGDGAGRLPTQDARRELGLYEGPTKAYRSDWPSSDDLGFYGAIHAISELAGRLVRRLPVVRRYDEGDDEYQRFLSKHRVTRGDGRWLSDRRDLAPPVKAIGEFSSTDSSVRDDDWLFAVRRDDFEEILEPSATTIMVWGKREVVTRSRSLDSHVRSALIDPVVAESFLRAVRSAQSTTPLSLPAAGDYESSKAGRFSLKGWIRDGGASTGRDAQDPFAGRIGYPPARPCDEVVAMYGLRGDEDLRSWTRGDRAVMHSVVWDDREEVSQSEMVGSSGDELVIDRGFLAELIACERRLLLVQVTIHPFSHHERRSYRDHLDEDNVSYVESSTMYYVIGKDGLRIEL